MKTFFTLMLWVFSPMAILTNELQTISILNDEVSIQIPKDFDIMPEALLKSKYPSERRPTLVYSNDSGGINVAFNLTQNKANQSLIETYTDVFENSFKNMFPSAVWKNIGTKEINGRAVGYLELITPAIDTEIYNLMFFTDLNGQLLLCTFNCTIKDMEDWVDTAHKIMHSLQLK